MKRGAAGSRGAPWLWVSLWAREARSSRRLCTGEERGRLGQQGGVGRASPHQRPGQNTPIPLFLGSTTCPSTVGLPWCLKG